MIDTMLLYKSLMDAVLILGGQEAGGKEDGFNSGSAAYVMLHHATQRLLEEANHVIRGTEELTSTRTQSSESLSR